MKRILTFEFDQEDNEHFEIISKADHTASAVAEFGEWLRTKTKHGFDDYEKTLLNTQTGENLAVLVLDMAREKFWELMNER